VKISPAPWWKPAVMLSTKSSEEEYMQVDLKGAGDINVNWTHSPEIPEKQRVDKHKHLGNEIG